jgi:hypothetical protein
VVAQAYLYTTRPNPGDPREHMHRATLNGLKMVGNKLSAKEEEAYRNKGTHKPRSPRCHNSPRHRSGTRYNSPKNKGTQRSRTPIKTHDYEDDEKEMGRHALLVGFASRQYPKVSNYLMTNKNMTDLRSHSHGFQTTYKQ